MSTANLSTTSVVPLRSRRFGLLASGVVAIAMGVVGLALVPLLTVATVLSLGVLFIGVAVYQLTKAVRATDWQGRAPHLGFGAVYAFGGLAMVFNPLGSAVGVTLFSSFALVLWGLHRVFGAPERRDVGRGALALVGGTLVILSWPTSGLWSIGIAVSAALLAIGWRNLVGGLALRRRLRPAPDGSSYAP
ncbi:hypothetical protein Thimo_2443 [Thioflavicoccus mobilis 8321]|uniref:Acid-resistance membrane protein n=1 Tax=Thioflavicoccus mobilis 8321 TaxID=765912 RepID=L0GYY0_9GAMM|nr:DUF308 domain-containing protein [Thioflavicoccus mobilis]AGA91176.1 hypothetical protein Thimo_2443 [Thioflavicoccus mobilis 8321]